MTSFILRNKRTGWQGSVTERMYHRLIAKDEYDDPRLQVAALSPEQRAFDVIETAPDTWKIVERSPGWYDVRRGDVVKNEKAMRKAAAEALQDKLNG